MISAKIAALVPMVVPMTPRVSGPIATMKMMNGIGRTKFTNTLSTVYTQRLARMPPPRVV